MHAMLPLVMVLALSASPAQAQEQSPQTRIVALGSGTVLAMPDGASITVSVETRSRSATEAAEENAARIQRVLEALRSAGFGEALTTSGYSLRPSYNRDTDVETYIANNGVDVALDDVGRAGEIIDLAVGAGANRIGSIAYTTSDQDDARKEALAMAVARAREDAEVMAIAAGGRLGALLEVTTDWTTSRSNEGYAEAIVIRRYAPPQQATTIEPGARPITVKVRTTWLMEGGG